MKCICNYEFAKDGGNGIPFKGDEPFIDSGTSFNDGFKSGHIVACPKCGTLKLVTKWEFDNNKIQCRQTVC